MRLVVNVAMEIVSLNFLFDILVSVSNMVTMERTVTFTQSINKNDGLLFHSFRATLGKDLQTPFIPSNESLDCLLPAVL